jgi:hypothetical protein
MGSCLTGEKDKDIKSSFHEDLEIEPKSDVYAPLNTTFYNILRKINDLVILQPNLTSSIPLLNGTINVNL